MGVRAKFTVVELKESLWPGSATAPTQHVVLSAAGGEDNKAWSKHTPSGRIEMQVDNPAALEQFSIGKSYFVDFTPAEPGEKKQD